MSIVYPRAVLTAGDPIDPDVVSATIQDFASEIDGWLGEQNFGAGGFTTLSSDVENDAVLRLDHYTVAVDWAGPAGASTFNGDGEPSSGRTNAIRVPSTLSWSSLITRTLTTSRGGTYEIVVSLQLDAGTTSNNAAYWDELVGCRLAFRIDGSIYEETTQGGTERSNDPTGDAVGWDIGCYTFSLAVALPQGIHVIELVGCPAKANTTVGSFTSTSFYELNNHEMWVEEKI